MDIDLESSCLFQFKILNEGKMWRHALLKMFLALYTNVAQVFILFLIQVHLFSNAVKSSCNSSSDDFLGAFLINIERVFPFVWIYCALCNFRKLRKFFGFI